MERIPEEWKNYRIDSPAFRELYKNIDVFEFTKRHIEIINRNYLRKEKITMRNYLPEIGWPVYDMRRRKFGICIDLPSQRLGLEGKPMALVHVEGDRYARHITADEIEYEYPKYYINDALSWYLSTKPGEVYYVKHVHLHVPRNIWQYTVAQQGIEGFDRFTVDGEAGLELIERNEPII